MSAEGIMKSIAAKKQGRAVSLIHVDLPHIKNDEIMISTLETGLCSTDRELLTDGVISPPEGSEFLILGHEALGKVVEVGSGVSSFRAGDLVVPTVRRGCGRCDFCNNGRSDMCSTGNYKERGIQGLHGFMSERFIENETNLIKMPDSMRRHAVLLEPMSVAIKAIEEAFMIQKTRLYGHSDRPSREVFEVFRNALIIGAGPIGLLTSLAMLYYKVNIFCADIVEHGGTKSTIIEELGGHYINLKEYQKGSEIDLQRIRNKTILGEVDCIIDASSHPLTCLQLIDVLTPNGVVAILGLPHKNGIQKVKTSELMSSLVLKNHIVMGSVNSNKRHFEKARDCIEVLQKQYYNVLSRIVTHSLPFSDYRQALEIDERDRIKVVLTWE
jgi:threonine dehydrogenase-like Zn-dependent dehydrogenase